MKVLFVDDEPSILRAIMRLFDEEEFEVVTAPSGPEGLQLLEREQEIALVISDYRMPGMNGVQFLSEVCRRWPRTLRLVLSGYADTGAVIEAINQGQIYKFIAKPWSDEALRQVILEGLELFRQPQPTGPLPMTVPASPEPCGRILAALPLCVCAFDPSGQPVYANPAWLRLFEVPEIILRSELRLESLPGEVRSLVQELGAQDSVSRKIELRGQPCQATATELDTMTIVTLAALTG